MSSQTKVIIYGLVTVLVMCAASYFAGRVKGREIGWKAGYSEGFEVGYNAPHPADTIVTIDSIFFDRPTEVVKWKERVVLMSVRDTVHVADSVFIEVPIEAKVYADSTYRAQVSGWRPSLDWIEVYQKTTTVTNYIEKPAPRWSIGLSVGPGIVYNGKDVHGGIGAVLGLQYRF